MSEPEQSKPEEEPQVQDERRQEVEVHDPAQALANMADEQGAEEDDESAEAVEVNPDPTEALDQLAGQRGEAAELDEMSAFEAGAPAGELELPAEAIPAGAEAGEARRAHAARAAGRAALVASHQYKRAMIPFLVVVAGLLLVVGLAAAVKLVSATPEQREYASWYLYMQYVMLVSFPLAAILGFGAWWFHQEVKGQ